MVMVVLCFSLLFSVAVLQRGCESQSPGIDYTGKICCITIIVHYNGSRQSGSGHGAGGRMPQHDEVPRIMNGKETLLHSGGTIGLGKQQGRLYPAYFL